MIWTAMRVWVQSQPRLRGWLDGLRGERGAASAEYALLLALVVIVLIGVLTDLGDVLRTRLEDIIGELEGAGS